MREPVDFAKNSIGEICRIQFVMFLNNFAQAFGAEKLAFGVGGFRDAVGMKDQDIAGLEVTPPFVVSDFLKDAERKASELHFAASAILIDQRLRLARVGDAQFVLLLPSRKAGGHEAAFDAPLADDLVHLPQHVGGLQFLRSEAAHDADRYGAVKSRGGAFAADIAKGDAELLRAVAKKFVEVAADFARGEIAGRHVEAVVFVGYGRSSAP